jgi:hypothetical protein
VAASPMDAGWTVALMAKFFADSSQAGDPASPTPWTAVGLKGSELPVALRQSKPCCGGRGQLMTDTCTITIHAGGTVQGELCL